MHQPVTGATRQVSPPWSLALEPRPVSLRHLPAAFVVRLLLWRDASRGIGLELAPALRRLLIP